MKFMCLSACVWYSLFILCGSHGSCFVELSSFVSGLWHAQGYVVLTRIGIQHFDNCYCAMVDAIVYAMYAICIRAIEQT
jgi:hypothetical protein